MQRFNINLFKNVKRKITIYALKLTLQQYHRLQEPAVLEDSIKLPNYTYRYATALGLSCAHDIKYRLNHNKYLKLMNFHGHWRYDQWAHKNNKSKILDLVQNPRVIKSKDRLKETLKNAYTSKSKSDQLTERDFSQHKLIELTLLGDLNKLKRIYKSKNAERPKNLKIILKIKPKPSPLKKQKRKQAETPKKTII